MNTPRKTPSLSPERIAKVKEKLEEEKEYLKEATSKSSSPGTLTSSGLDRGVDATKIQQRIVNLERLIQSNEKNIRVLTTAEKDEIWKQYNKDKKWLGDNSQSLYDLDLFPNSKDKDGYRKAYRKAKIEVTPQFQSIFKRYKRCAELVAPQDYSLRDGYSFRKNKHI